MWQSEIVDQGEGARRIRIQRGTALQSFAQVLESWCEDALFRDWFGRLIAGVPYAACF